MDNNEPRVNRLAVTNMKLDERGSKESQQEDNVEVEKAIAEVKVPWLHSCKERGIAA